MDFTALEGKGLLSGNEILVRGALEGGASLLTGYPGSPLAEVFDIIYNNRDYLKSLGIQASLANNEAQSVAMLGGAQDVGHRAVAFMKSVGLHVASDPLFVVNLSGTGPGGANVVCVGDDPWNLSTQVPADSRFLFQHLHMPVIEPATMQEMKDWVKLALDLSHHVDLSVGYIVTTHQAEAGSLVDMRKIPVTQKQGKSAVNTANIDLARRIAVPPNTAMMEVHFWKQRFPKVLEFIRQSSLNKLEDRGGDVLVITSGLATQHTRHVLKESGLNLSLLHLGCTYPLDPDLITTMAKRFNHFIIIEEKRSFIEDQIKKVLFDHGLSHIKVLGKTFEGSQGFPSSLGLNPYLVANHLFKLACLKNWSWGKLLSPLVEVMEKSENQLAKDLSKRPPTFCPGCPHRETMATIKEYKSQTGQDVFTHGDVGCYSLSFLPPFREMHNFSAMGFGGATASGTDKYISNQQTVTMGDSTFFHTGMVNISHSIKEGQNILYLILDNKNTAMTGHQPTPADGMNIMGTKTHAQDIETICRGLDPQMFVRKIHPSDRQAYLKVMEEALLQKGTKVIIADKECGITFHGRLRSERRKKLKAIGYIPEEEFINITPEVCENCRECTKRTGCPGLTTIATDYEEKVAIDPGVCVSDTYCTTFKVCPSFEKVKIRRKSATKLTDLSKAFSLKLEESQNAALTNGSFQAVVAGIGGTGVTLVSSLLSEAAIRDGYSVTYVDQKGLAQRNGAVLSFLTIGEEQTLERCSTVALSGQADILLGLDLLESARNVKYISQQRSNTVLNRDETPTTPMIMGEERFPKDLPEKIKNFSKSALVHSYMTYAQMFFGNRVFANIMMLGSALQKGWLPVSAGSLLEALREQTKTRDPHLNEQALKLGRLLAVYSPAELGLEQSPTTYQEWKTEAKNYVEWSFWLNGKSQGEKFDQQLQWVEKNFPQHCWKPLGVRLRDLRARNGSCDSFFQYLQHLHRKKISADNIVILAKTYAQVSLVKDEVWVANLLTSPQKLKADQKRYQLNPDDQIEYFHINRPRFDIGPWKIEFDLQTKNWMLGLMRHGRFIRKLLPKWHAIENDFRDWVIGTVLPKIEDAQDLIIKHVYDQIMDANGYREIRYPKIQRLRQSLAKSLEVN